MNTLLWSILDAVLIFAAYVIVAYALAMYDICFTFGREGAAKAIVKGAAFDHFIMWWQGHRLNDPRRLSFVPGRPWEVLETGDTAKRPSAYAWWQIHWKVLELFGIYWYGLYPFKQVYIYNFKWIEQTLGEDNKMKPWYRDEFTDFIFVMNFAYWVKLVAAEDKENEPLDLDYLLTIHINNPYWALFRIDDWLGRTSADANNAAKRYVGSNTFEHIKAEMLNSTSTMSDFAEKIHGINTNSVTEPGEHGVCDSYGVTVKAASLVAVALVGSNREELEKAKTAIVVAEQNAKASVATAKGDADATRERAKGQADAIETVYRKVDEFDNGVVLQSLDALKEASKSPGSTIIWANNPLGGLTAALDGLVTKPRTARPPESPPST